MSMIQVEHVCKNYHHLRALNDISFEVNQGEIVGFLGPNGAGKTTTMRILTGYLPPSEGRASVAGFDVFEASLEARRHIGYLPESAPLYNEMTVYAYLDYVARLRRLSKRHPAIQRAMEACHIADRARSLIGKLSKGLRQRVGLAQAILHEPDVLILDEPTIGLDPRQIIQVRELIQELGREHTILLSTHILPEVSQTCSRVLIIHKGQIVGGGAPADLTAQLQGGSRIQVRIGGAADDPLPLLRQLPDVSQVQAQGEGLYELICASQADHRADVARAIVGQGWDLLELRGVNLSLEDIFLKLTTDDAAARLDMPAEPETPESETEENDA